MVYTGDFIKITAKNIGTDISAVVAKVNNISATIVANSIIGGTGCNIVVPAKCGNGPITLTKAGKTAIGPDFFYIPSATVATLYGKIQ